MSAGQHSEYDKAVVLLSGCSGLKEAARVLLRLNATA